MRGVTGCAAAWVATAFVACGSQPALEQTRVPMSPTRGGLDGGRYFPPRLAERTDFRRVELAPAIRCVSSQDQVVHGLATGFAQCSTGMLHRPRLGSCPYTILPRSDPLRIPKPSDGFHSECAADGDCREHAYGQCVRTHLPLYVLNCRYGCADDSDCGAGTICFCGNNGGRCVEASCTSDQDCPLGAVCGLFIMEPMCEGIAFACQTASDECSTVGSCSVDEIDDDDDRELCYFRGGRRVCGGGGYCME